MTTIPGNINKVIIPFVPSDRTSRRLDEDNGGTAQDDGTNNYSYFSQIEGYETFRFSLYIPSILNEDEDQIIDSLESIIRLFLCSRDNVDLVMPVDESNVTSVCPFEDGRRRTRRTTSRQKRAEHTLHYSGERWRRFLEDIFKVESDVTVLWNIPKIMKETIIHVEEEGDSSAVSDSRGNARERRLVEVDYYTQWNFTYPVYQWARGEDGSLSEEFAIQTLLDESINDGTIDSVLPWEDARASVIGNENQTFWTTSSAGTVAPSSLDTPVPPNQAFAMQMFGVSISLVTLLVVAILTYLGKRHRLEQEAIMKRLADSRGHEDQSQRSFFHVDTEEGVIEMLLESKLYALEQRSGSMATIRARNGQFVSPEQDLKEGQLLLQAKRDVMVGESSSSSHSRTGGTNLLTPVDYDDGEDDAYDHDLDFSFPSINRSFSSCTSAEGSTHGSVTVQKTKLGSIDGDTPPNAVASSTAKANSQSFAESSRKSLKSATSNSSTKMVDLDDLFTRK